MEEEEEGEEGREEGACGARTWLAYGELHGAPRVEQLLDQRLGQHGGREEDGPTALAVEGVHRAVGDQAEVLAELTLRVQLWEGTAKGCLWLGRGHPWVSSRPQGALEAILEG